MVGYSSFSKTSSVCANPFPEHRTQLYVITVTDAMAARPEVFGKLKHWLQQVSRYSEFIEVTQIRIREGRVSNTVFMELGPWRASVKYGLQALTSTTTRSSYESRFFFLW